MSVTNTDIFLPDWDPAVFEGRMITGFAGRRNSGKNQTLARALDFRVYHH